MFVKAIASISQNVHFMFCDSYWSHILHLQEFIKRIGRISAMVFESMRFVIQQCSKGFDFVYSLGPGSSSSQRCCSFTGGPKIQRSTSGRRRLVSLASLAIKHLGWPWAETNWVFWFCLHTLARLNLFYRQIKNFSSLEALGMCCHVCVFEATHSNRDSVFSCLDTVASSLHRNEKECSNMWHCRVVLDPTPVMSCPALSLSVLPFPALTYPGRYRLACTGRLTLVLVFS